MYTTTQVVDATPIHGMCGVLGVVAPACFATPKMYAQTYGVSGSRADRCAGIFYGGSGESLAASLIFLAALVAWVALLVSAVFRAETRLVAVGFRCAADPSAARTAAAW